jgi:hypothetical protein
MDHSINPQIPPEIDPWVLFQQGVNDAMTPAHPTEQDVPIEENPAPSGPSLLDQLLSTDAKDTQTPTRLSAQPSGTDTNRLSTTNTSKTFTT